MTKKNVEYRKYRRMYRKQNLWPDKCIKWFYKTDRNK